MSAHHPIRIKYRVLVTMLLVTLPALAIAGFFALGVGQSQLRDSYGLLLGRMAEQTAAAADNFVFRRVIDVSVLARIPIVRDIAATTSADAPTSEDVTRLDRLWQRPGNLPLEGVALLNSPASLFLQDVVSHDTVYREILATDRHGRLAAASGVTTDYYQGDEAWWIDSATRGQVAVSDVVWDESAQVFAVEIAAPIRAASGSVVGVLKAVIDTRELFAAIHGMGVSGPGETVLVRRNGTVVFSRASVDPSTQYFAADLVRERLQGVQPGDTEYRSSFRANNSAGEPQVVALAASQVARSFPHLSWFVAVSESERLLFAPVRAQLTNLLLAFAVVALLFVIAVVWWSVRLATPPDPDLPALEMHLSRHPEVLAIGEDREARPGPA